MFRHKNGIKLEFLYTTTCINTDRVLIGRLAYGMITLEENYKNRQSKVTLMYI